MAIKGSEIIWHKDVSAEVWNHYEGDPIKLTWLEDGEYKEFILGSSKDNYCPFFVMPENCW